MTDKELAELHLKIVELFQQYKSEHDSEDTRRDLATIREMQSLFTTYATTNINALKDKEGKTNGKE